MTGAANIAAAGSVNQGQENKLLPIASSVSYQVTDSLGNLICPRDPNRKLLGSRQITTNFATASGAAVLVTGLSCPVIVPANRRVRVTFMVPNSHNTNIATSRHSIWDGVVASGTLLQEIANLHGIAGNRIGMSLYAVQTPAAGARTYNAGIRTDTGTETMEVSVAGAPAIITVELA